MKILLFKSILLISILGLGSLPAGFAQDISGGVDVPGIWYPGMGVQKGDYYSYKLCHVNYQECKDFQLDFWFEGDIRRGTEDQWLVQTVVYDGNKIIKGTMELGKLAPEPTGGSDNIAPYRSAFKTSIVWLSAFSNEGNPKEFRDISWGKIANIGGQQVRPTSVELVSTPSGAFETVMISWRTGGATSKIWIYPELSFPVKASTWTQVSEGKAPQEYKFELIDYELGIANPFTNIIDTETSKKEQGCQQNYEFESIKRSTNDFLYLLNVKYGPKNPVKGCDLEFIIEFKKYSDETEFLNEVQYDIIVVDEQLSPLRSVAQDEGSLFLFSPSGQVRRTIPVEENPGTAHYVIWIYGLSPKILAPSPNELDYLQVDIKIADESPIITPPPKKTPEIPSWIKTTAGFWVDEFTSDDEFVRAIEYLINEKIIVIPPTAGGTGTGTTEIPAWIKTTTGFWVDGFTSDDEFVRAIQWLIEKGIMRIA